MESMPLSMMKHLEDDVPPVFMILDTYDKDIKVSTIDLFSIPCFIFCYIHILINYFTLELKVRLNFSTRSSHCFKAPARNFYN